MWSTVLRACVETYFIGTIGAFRNSEYFDWDSGENVVNSIVTLFAIPGVIIFPFWVLSFLRKNALLA